MATGTNKYGFRIFIGKILRSQHILTINPQELDQDELSKINISETFGGAYADDYGRSPSIPIVISGHTGFKGKGGFLSGADEFFNLRDNIYRNKDIPGAKIIFDNFKDDEHWVVSLMGFKMKKTVASPVLYHYTITMRTLDVYNNMFPFEDSIGGFFADVRQVIKNTSKNLSNNISNLLAYGTSPFAAINELFNTYTTLITSVSSMVEQVGIGVANIASISLTSIAAAITAGDSLRRYIDGDLANQLVTLTDNERNEIGNLIKNINFNMGTASTWQETYPEIDQTDITQINNTNIEQYLADKNETLQDIALKKYGNSNYWQYIADINNLLPGDTLTAKPLVIPKIGAITVQTPQTKSSITIIQSTVRNSTVLTSDIIANILFGTDIDSYIHTTVSGDLVTVEGEDNIKQALESKIKCHVGGLLENTSYGNLFDQIIGQPGLSETINQIKTEIQRTLLMDDRIDSIDNIDIEQIENDAYSVTVNLNLIGNVSSTIPFSIPKGG